MKTYSSDHIFHDPTNRRWHVFLLVVFICLSPIIGSFIFFFVQIFISGHNVNKLNLKVSGSPTEVFNVDNDNKITFFKIPDSSKIALTFDDGPDPRNTEKILRILKNYNVKATFFIVGSNANTYPEILEKIYKDGHDIGNHTYSHPNSQKVGDFRYRLEIQATQKVVETRLGVGILTFRAPYSDDQNPETIDQFRPLSIASNLGYINIGMKIDPKDWKAKDAYEIVDFVENGVKNKNGKIILLHDGGDDRSKTIEALPRIIESLQSKGYQFVTVSNLLETPISTKIDRDINSYVDLFALNIMRYSNGSLIVIGFISTILGSLRFLLVCSFAIVEKRRKNQKIHSTNYYPKVAAIVPGYNEEKVVNKTIESLLNSSYSNLEVVVIDDGSTDKTYEVAMSFYGDNKQVKIFKKDNGGKSLAINFGLSKTDAEIVVILDADTLIKSDAIELLVRHFDNPNVGAVAGNAKVGNQLNLLTRMQAIEYITSQNLDRRAFCFFNCIRVVAGAIGAWRRSVLIEAGEFTNDTLAEDTDMTLKILRLGYIVEYDATAIAYTEAPESITTFMKQRFRWFHGTLQAVWKHLDTLFRPKFGMMGILAIPDVLLFQVLFPLFAPIMDFLLIYNTTLTIASIIDHPTNYSTLALKQAFGFYILFLFFEYAAAILSFTLEKKENWKLLPLLILQRFIYRQLIYITAIKSTLIAIKGSRVGWGKFERTASVQLPSTP